MSEEYARAVLQILSGNVDVAVCQSGKDLKWWTSFIAYSSKELVSPGIGFEFCRSNGLSGYVPEDVVDYFVATYTLNTIRNKSIIAEILEVSRVLNSVGVVPILLKGSSALIKQSQPSIGYRIQGDIDILVPDESFLAVVEKIKDRGYFVRSDLVEKYFLSRNYSKLSAYPELVRPGAEAAIDVHRTPTFYLKRGAQFLSDAHARSELVALDGAEVSVLNPVDEFIHSLYHSQVHDMDQLSGCVRLRYILDLLNLRKSAMTMYEEKEIDERLREYGLFQSWQRVSQTIDYLNDPNGNTPSVMLGLGLKHPDLASFTSRLLRIGRIIVSSPERYMNWYFYRVLFDRLRN